MRKRLGKITQSLALATGLLRVKPQMVSISQHVLEQQPCLIEHCGFGLTCACQRFDQPERADIKSALLARQPVDALSWRIAIYQPIAYQAAALRTFENRSKRSQHAPVRRRQEENQRHDQQRSVEVFAAVMLRERMALAVPTARHYLLVDTISLFYPSLAVCWKCTFVGEADAAIERDPIHYLRIDEMLLAIPHLPYSRVRRLPVLADPIEPGANSHPEVVVDRTHVLVVEVQRIENFAVDIVLILLDRLITNADGLRLAISFPMIQSFLWQPTVAVDGEDHRQPLPRVRAQVRTILNPIDKIRGFRGEAEAQKRVNRKGRVPQPRIAIIPIARPADHFGKTGRGSCDDRPCRFECQQLEHQR